MAETSGAGVLVQHTAALLIDLGAHVDEIAAARASSQQV
jgi:hypothetical protein